MKTTKGFSLIEVLVTLLLTSVGILGMVALQGRAINYTTEAVHRDSAVSLSNELIEIMRPYRDDLYSKTPPLEYSYTELKPTSVVYNASGALQLNQANCPSSLPQTLQEQANCWMRKVESVLPGTTDADVRAQFKVCPSFKLGGNGAPECAGNAYQGSSLAIQVAWRSREAVCGPNQTSDICTFVTRVEL